MTNSSVTGNTDEKLYYVNGTVRDLYQQPLPSAVVSAYSVGLRSRQLLGEAATDRSGHYTISYQPQNTEGTALVIAASDITKKYYKESDVLYNVPESLQQDIDLSGKPFAGVPEYEQLINQLAPFTEEVPLAHLTETAKNADISFIVQKAGLQRDTVEKLVMAARFATYSPVAAEVWYGILRNNLPPQQRGVANDLRGADFETRLGAAFDGLMQTNTEVLTSAVQKAAEGNIIALSVTATLPAISEQLSTQMLSYANAHPVTGAPSLLQQKLILGGLTGNDLQSFIKMYNNNKGTDADFWKQLPKSADFINNENIDRLQAVFQLSSLTNDNLPLTEILLKSQNITSAAAIKKLAGYKSSDWEALIATHNITQNTIIRGASLPVTASDYAKKLEAAFTYAFPTAAFAARLKNDIASTLPGKEKINSFLEENENFDLVNDRIGKFMKENKITVADQDAEELSGNLRRVQRVLKLTQVYDNAQVLLNDNIHSAMQVYKMGKDNFVNKYGGSLGTATATNVFDKASKVHATSVALVGNLKSMADASALNAFPDYKTPMLQQLATELPTLDTLFGSSDNFDCSECDSVYGAPAYLTDILHFLDQRKSLLAATANGTVLTVPSLKDVLLRRRPDIGNIDLCCDNTDTQMPYIDIACEVMEDYIAPPVITIAQGTYSSLLVKGVINATLLSAIQNQYTATGQSNISNLLTPGATVSEPYTVNHLQADNTYLTQTHWMIRDSGVALQASADIPIKNQPSSTVIEIRLSYQTLLSSTAIDGGPEYINNNVYANFLRTAVRPFMLPFDLFETEGESYLQKLGVAKTDIINAFSPKTNLAPGASPADLNAASAYLGINEAEQTLIFVEDPTHQALYWGAVAASTSIETDLFEQLAGLSYVQILNLIQLQFIDPLKDIVIEYDSLSADTTKMHVTNLTPIKLDAIHRFLRLWRKTSFTMDEMDAIIMCSGIGQGKITGPLAWQLQQFLLLQQKLNLSAFQLLAFYGLLDTAHNFPDCQYNLLFQNNEVTNPVSPNFSIAAVTPGTLPITDPDIAIIATVLQISIDEVNLLLGIDGHTNLAMNVLSDLYAYAQLAQSMQMPVSNLVSLLNLYGVHLSDVLNSPYATDLFIQNYKLVQSAGFGMSDLDYLYDQTATSGNNPLVPSFSQVNANLSALQSDLLVVRAVTQPVDDPNGVLLTQWLSDPVLNWNISLLTKLLDILGTVDDTDYKNKLTDNNDFLLNLRMLYPVSVLTADLSALPFTNGTPAVPIAFPASIATQLSFDANNKQLVLAGYMSQADLTALLAISNDPNYQAALNMLFTKAQQTDSSAANIFFATATDISTGLGELLSGNTAGRFDFFINKLAPAYLKLQQQNVLTKNISTWFKVDKTIVSQLLVSIPGIYIDFTNDSFVDKIVTVNDPDEPYPTQYGRYQLIAKACFVVARLKLTDTDLAFLIPNAVAIGCVDLSTFASTAPRISDLETLINLLLLDQYYPAVITDPVANTSISIFTIIQNAIGQGALTGAALTTYITSLDNNLVLLTGWNPADLGALISSPNYLGLSLPADIISVPVLFRLRQCFTVLQQLGVSAADAVNWSKPSLLFADSTKIKQVLQLRYSASDWQQVTKPLQDGLRENKRDALIAYLLANPGNQSWETADDLYGYFLLDVEMCSCQPTSRIVQATNNVQLFVQRCALNLESSIAVDSTQDSNWLQWEWMKNFSLWQANVKVFLYPENYIEPELLPVEIKSPFLADLENDLLQGEVTAENVEDAFQNYLEQLSGVARLEVKGQWYDDSSQTLHVFGRTYGGDPKVYYYRKFIQGRRWTPWVKVDLDIKSEFVIPVVYNNHVYLFWAIIKDLMATSTTAAQWQIQLAYSEFKNGKWAAKKISESNESGQISCLQSSFPDMTRFFFTPLDMPIFDYSTVHQVTNPSADLPYIKSILNAITHNGTIVISCCYYNLYTANAYVESFQLDIAKGYPVTVVAIANLELKGSDGTIQTKNLINMLETELTAPPLTNVPSSNATIPDQSRGIFTKPISFQMSMKDRSFFIDQLSTLNVIFTGELLPYFYQDHHRSYYIRPERTDSLTYELTYEDYLGFAERTILGYVVITGDDAKIESELSGPLSFRYFNFYHSMIGTFMQRLFINGVGGLISRDTQLQGDPTFDTSPNKFNFSSYYSDLIAANTIYKGPSNSGYPIENVDFDLQSGYGLYNWELFFHAPLMIAERLSQNQQFDDADTWYKYIFNPMDTSTYPSPSKYWNTQPFFLTTVEDYTDQRIDQVLMAINSGNQALIQDVADLRNNPFQPHYIAEYRTVAYQKTAVMKYIAHLIRYGDYLFQQDTMESVNQATQLYILAAQILGPKPEPIPSVAQTAVDNYYQLQQNLDVLSDALVDVENLMPQQLIIGYNGTANNTPGLPNLQSLYFCIPMNENMTGPTGYWDTVADRLFKIRHCLNIEGVLAPLALFAPAIDPGMLVRATAAGVDIGSILNDMNAPLPLYRFMMMIQKATELCNEVKSLGSLMLSVLEKKDAEALALLRSSQEITILNNTLLVKQMQINDAQSTLDNLEKLKDLTTIRQVYYQGLHDGGKSLGESAALVLNALSTGLDLLIVLSYLFGAGAHAAPDGIVGASVGVGGGPIALAKDGGSNAGDAADSTARNIGAVATGFDKVASLISTNSGYDRRDAEWQFQINLANKELEQIDKQIEGAQIRLQIVNQDLLNQQTQIDQAQATDDLMHSKFTNEDLYNWMITQVSATYFKTYQLAYALAKKAERCFRFELGLGDSAYINFGYWDSLKKGLLAGEQLSFDIKAMESAYYDQNKRELELSKPISLLRLDPVALMQLTTTGACWINLPEELFDMDYPGHYMRRVKSVSISIPCISGPFTTISCQLTMTRNSIRTSGVSPAEPASYPRNQSATGPTDDPRFRDSTGVMDSIATSSAQNDSGLFELNFRDERYLPFEGAGAISMWYLQLPAAIRQFDYDTISDVIIHLKYTARDGGQALRAIATTSLNTRINQMLVDANNKGLMCMINLKRDLPDAWYQFLNTVSTNGDQVLTLGLDNTWFPLFVQTKTITINVIELIAESTTVPAVDINLNLSAPSEATPDAFKLTAKDSAYGNWLSGSKDYGNNGMPLGAWTIDNPKGNTLLTAAQLNNMVILIHYTVS